MDSSDGLFPRLVQLLNNPFEWVIHSTLRLVAEIVLYATETSAYLLFIHKAVKPLLNILANGSMRCKKLAADAIIGITQGISTCI